MTKFKVGQGHKFGGLIAPSYFRPTWFWSSWLDHIRLQTCLHFDKVTFLYLAQSWHYDSDNLSVDRQTFLENSDKLLKTATVVVAAGNITIEINIKSSISIRVSPSLSYFSYWRHIGRFDQRCIGVKVSGSPLKGQSIQFLFYCEWYLPKQTSTHCFLLNIWLVANVETFNKVHAVTAKCKYCVLWDYGRANT